jgi:hypothetical protein
MEDSILVTIKKLLGIHEDYLAFDTDIIVLINSALMTLQQLGVGPDAGMIITGYSETWDDLIPSGIMMDGVKHYIFLCVKMVFDPPAGSYVLDSMKQQKEELEWRLREQAEFYPGDGSRLGYWQQVAADEEAAKDGDGDG